MLKGGPDRLHEDPLEVWIAFDLGHATIPFQSTECHHDRVQAQVALWPSGNPACAATGCCVHQHLVPSHTLPTVGDEVGEPHKQTVSDCLNQNQRNCEGLIISWQLIRQPNSGQTPVATSQEPNETGSSAQS